MISLLDLIQKQTITLIALVLSPKVEIKGDILSLGEAILRQILQGREWLELGKDYNREVLPWRIQQSSGHKTRLDDQTVHFICQFTVLSFRRKGFLEQVAK